MKKILLITILLAFGAGIFVACEKDLLDEPNNDLELKSGKLTGYDQWGFNWQAQQFRGYFLNVFFADHMFAGKDFYKKALFTGKDEFYWDEGVLKGGGQSFIDTIAQYYPGYPSFFYYLVPDCQLKMHWNDDLINKDGEYAESWLDSEAWITFHYSGTDQNGKRWSQFQKMVAAKSDDILNKEKGLWFNKDSVEIGLFNEWNQLIMVQVVNTGEPPIPFSFFPSYKNTLRLGFGKTKK